jgi:hypothetical protein
MSSQYFLVLLKFWLSVAFGPSDATQNPIAKRVPSMPDRLAMLIFRAFLAKMARRSLAKNRDSRNPAIMSGGIPRHERYSQSLATNNL